MKTSLKTPTAGPVGAHSGAMTTGFASACAGGSVVQPSPYPSLRGRGVDRSLPVAARTGRGFTLVELIVVITVIVIILALAVPGLTAMNNDAREKAAQQTINGLLMRAYYAAAASNTMTAVRFMPAEWDASDREQQSEIRGRQRMTVYSFTPTTDVENNGSFTVQFEEYFKRAKDIGSETLPPDMWVAPLEALTERKLTLADPNDISGRVNHQNFGRDVVLYGQPFSGDPNSFLPDGRNHQNAERTMDADDFLVVFDPQTGLRSGTPQSWWMYAYDPRPANYRPPGAGPEHAGTRNGGVVNFANIGAPYTRLSFSGLVLYGRENLVQAYKTDNAQGMQNYLQANGVPLMIQRFGGGLVRGLPDLNQAGS